MTTEGKGDVKISGAGSASGGVYNTVSISGAGRITGDIEAEKITISGAAKIEGSVRAGTFSASGAAKVEGDLQAQTAKCAGATKITGNVSATEFKASGAAKVGGNCKAEEVKLSGACKLGGDLEAERLFAADTFAVAGLVNADSAQIVLGGECRAGEIGGGRLTIVQAGNKPRFNLPMWWCREGTLQAETIEGDEIYLEGTTAARVRGRRVGIGRDCHIGQVEYSESLQIDPRAEVNGHQYAGTGPGPAVGQDRLSAPDGWAKDHADKGYTWGPVHINSEIRNPVLRTAAVAGALLLPALFIFLVLPAVLPAVGVILVIVVIVLGGVVALLLATLVGVPLVVAGAVLLRLLLLPLELLGWMFGRRRRRYTH